MNKLFIQTSDFSVQTICQQDPIMKKLITVIGDFEVTLRTDYFASLVRSIIGQLISVHAANAIYGRLEALLEGNITAQAILKQPNEALRQVGLTYKKVDYVKDLAHKVVRKELDLEKIQNNTNEAIINQLTQVKGIGKWTAEVFLILSLGREDVLAIDDVAIQRAAKWLYEVEISERRHILGEKSSLWKPYRSIAAYYLWEAIHLGYIEKYDSIDQLIDKNKS